jgi:RepB DNA-primase from phage plasmid
MSQMWALHDSDPKTFPMLRIHPGQANDYNAKGYGIFQTVNEFTGPRRIENLTRINAWAVDIDDGTKEAQIIRFNAGLVPTLVVETKRGYQAYWAAKDAKKEHWNAIVLERLVPFYGADKNARDLARILRKPGYYHLKNPNEPFLVRKVFEWNVAYTELQMAMFYPSLVSRERSSNEYARVKKEVPVSGGFWDRVANLDCEDALIRLSGHAYVGGETYSFKANPTGTKNIFVNGKGTSCWIDRAGKIGSLDDGGPTIYQWLNWFHKNPKRVAEMIKEVFPECRVM